MNGNEGRSFYLFLPSLFFFFGSSFKKLKKNYILTLMKMFTFILLRPKIHWFPKGPTWQDCSNFGPAEKSKEKKKQENVRLNLFHFFLDFFIFTKKFFFFDIGRGRCWILLSSVKKIGSVLKEFLERGREILSSCCL